MFGNSVYCYMKNSPKLVLYKIIFGIFLVVTLGCAAYGGNYLYRYFGQKSLGGELADLYDKIPPLESIAAHDEPKVSQKDSAPQADASPEPETPQNERLLLALEQGKIRFAEFLNINPEFIGFLIIEGLDVKEPFVQAANNIKYLNVNFKGENSSYGTVFLHSGNNSLLTDKNIILFGHRARENMMFTPITKYKTAEDVKNAPVIILDSLTGRTSWLVFAAYTCSADFGYINTFENENEFELFLEQVRKRSIFNSDIKVTKDDQILTLSTCAYDFSDARFVVHARKMQGVY